MISLKRTSANTNSLVLVDVKAAFSSPLAEGREVGEKSKTGSHGSLGFVPPDAETRRHRRRGELHNARPRLPDRARQGRATSRACAIWRPSEGGTADEIAGRLAVLSPRDVYFTSFSGQELAAVYPADRQYTARYVKCALSAKTPPLSPYLLKAVEKADGNTITIALDLEDVVDRTIVRMSLPSSPSVTNVKTVDVNLLATLLSTVKGMTVAIKITDTVSASLTVEFGNDPSLFRRTLPELCPRTDRGPGHRDPRLRVVAADVHPDQHDVDGSTRERGPQADHLALRLPLPSGEGDPTAKGSEPSGAMTKRYITAVETILTDVTVDARQQELRQDRDVARQGRGPDRAAERAGRRSPGRETRPSTPRRGCGRSRRASVACPSTRTRWRASNTTRPARRSAWSRAVGGVGSRSFSARPRSRRTSPRSRRRWPR